MSEDNSGWLLKHRDGVEHGPFELTDLVAAARAGHVAHDTYVRHGVHTRGQWVAATRLPPIAEAAQGKPTAAVQGGATTAAGDPATAQGNPATAQGNPATAQGNPATAQGNPATAQGNAGHGRDTASPTMTRPPVSQTAATSNQASDDRTKTPPSKSTLTDSSAGTKPSLSRDAARPRTLISPGSRVPKGAARSAKINPASPNPVPNNPVPNNLAPSDPAKANAAAASPIGLRPAIRGHSEESFPVPKTFWKALVVLTTDFRFRRFVTPWIVKGLWALASAAACLAMLKICYDLLIQPSVPAPGPWTEQGEWQFQPLGEQSIFQAKKFTLAVQAMAIGVGMLCLRVLCELTVVLFRVGGEIGNVRKLLQPPRNL